MKKLLIIYALFAVFSAYAQEHPDKQAVLAQLKEYNVAFNDMTLNAQPTSTDFSFTMQVETPDPQYPVTYLAQYDPAKDPAWEMTSWNGKAPEKYQKKILEDRVERYAAAPVNVDESTLGSAREGEYLVISFRIDPATAPSEYMYYKDCDGHAYINTKTGHLEKTVWTNFQPTKNQSVHVKKMLEEITFTLIDGVYHVAKETQHMGGSVDTKKGEASGEADQVITYSNFRKLN